MKAVSTRNDEPERASRPFDRDRDGFVISEGAGIVVVEDWNMPKRVARRFTVNSQDTAFLPTPIT